MVTYLVKDILVSVVNQPPESIARHGNGVFPLNEGASWNGEIGLCGMNRLLCISYESQHVWEVNLPSEF